MKHLATFWQNESGATAIEYGLLAALVAGAAMIGMDSLAQELSVSLDRLNDKLSSQTGSNSTTNNQIAE